MDRVRFMRLLVYEGPRSVVEKTLASSIRGSVTRGNSKDGFQTIAAFDLTQFPETVDYAEKMMPQIYKVEQENSDAIS